jgi:hypothetical protein
MRKLSAPDNLEKKNAIVYVPSTTMLDNGWNLTLISIQLNPSENTT